MASSIDSSNLTAILQADQTILQNEEAKQASDSTAAANALLQSLMGVIQSLEKNIEELSSTSLPTLAAVSSTQTQSVNPSTNPASAPINPSSSGSQGSSVTKEAITQTTGTGSSETSDKSYKDFLK
jgi:hypothetical protein